MRIRSLLFGSVLTVTTLAASAVLAQRASERIEVTVIEVPVTVADRSGNSVRGLTAANFQLFVDGKRTPVEYFEAVDLTKISAANAGTQQPLPPAAYRNFLLLFDLANSAPSSLARAQQAARDFVNTSIGERDLVAVATFTTEQGPRLVTSFTRNREMLLNAVNTLGHPSYYKVADPLLISFATPTQQAGPEGGIDKGQEEALRDLLESGNQANAQANANEQRGRIRKQLNNFGALARSLDALRGQKQIILLSEGFDAKLLTGRTDLSSQEARAENDAVLSGEIWKVDSDQRFGSASETNEVNVMADLFRRSDVRLHAIDIRGLRSEVDAREGVRKSNNDALFLLTGPTGGTVLRNTNDLSGQFRQLLRQQEVVYLLGFRATPTGKPGQFHNVKVKLTGANGEVTHRAGFYERPERTNNLETTLSLSELLMTDAAIRDVPLDVVSTVVPGGGNTARVPVVVDASGPQLLQGVTGAMANASIFVYAFDEKRQVRDFMQQRVALDVAKTGDTLRAGGVRYVGALSLPAGTYDLKTVVRIDETGRTGVTTSRLTVPEFGASAVMAPVAAAAPGTWITLVSATRGADATSLLTLGEQPFIPRSRVEASSGSEQDIVLMLRGIAVENLAITPMLVAPDGSAQRAPITLAGRTSPDDHGVVKLLFKLKPETVAAGEYDLRFTVVPAGGRPTVVSIPVVIR